MRAAGRSIAQIFGLIDEFVTLLVLVAGFAFAVVVAIGGASLVQVGMVLFLTAIAVGWWTWTSNVRDWLRRSSHPSGGRVDSETRG